MKGMSYLKTVSLSTGTNGTPGEIFYLENKVADYYGRGGDPLNLVIEEETQFLGSTIEAYFKCKRK